MRARRAASSLLMPAAWYFAVRPSRCAHNSSSSSLSAVCRRSKLRSRKSKSCGIRHLLRGPQHLAHGGGQFLPRFLLNLKLAASALRELVKLCFTIIFGSAPLRIDPSAALQAVQRGIERALLNAQQVAGHLLNALRYSPAVERLQGNSAEDQQIKCALRKINGLR